MSDVKGWLERALNATQPVALFEPLALDDDGERFNPE
jgi:hypothetical protein